MRVHEVQKGQSVSEAEFRGFDIYREWVVETDDSFAVYLMERDHGKTQTFLGTIWERSRDAGERRLLDAEEFVNIGAAQVFVRDAWDRLSPDKV